MNIREDALRFANGNTLMAAIDLTIGLGANKPDDTAAVRLGWPIMVSAERAIAIMEEPRLDVEAVAALALRRADRDGLIMHNVPIGIEHKAGRHTRRAPGCEVCDDLMRLAKADHDSHNGNPMEYPGSTEVRPGWWVMPHDDDECLAKYLFHAQKMSES